ncbi:hypothetical protein ABTZ57_41550, partial [Streptomyces sp. NPDC094048]
TRLLPHALHDEHHPSEAKASDLRCPSKRIKPTLHAYLRWRSANARHPDVLAAHRRERARIRSEKGIHWGGRPLPAVA